MRSTIEKRLIVGFLLILIVNYTKAQGNNRLKIGDSFPDFMITNILNDEKATSSTTVFKDKLLIIDFWATTCSGCVAALPKMQRLQEQFGNKIKILPVTYEDRKLVLEFWKTNKFTKNLNLATVVEDKKIKNLFPHQVIPHEVWINNGKIIGFTEHEYVDAYNIKEVLDGRIPDWPVKNDYYAFDGVKEPLFKINRNQIDVESTKVEYAAISDYKEKDGSSAAGPFGNMGIVRDSIKKTLRTYFINLSIFNAYFLNWNRVINLNELNKPSFSVDPNQIVWEVKNPLKYMHSSPLTPQLKTEYVGDWMKNNAICFESLKPDSGQSNKTVSKDIIDDLNRLLGLNVRWEKRKEKVLVLVKTKEIIHMRTPLSEDKNVVNSVASLIYHLNQQPENPYVFKSDKVDDFELNIIIKSWTDIDTIRKTLHTVGLDLIDEERLVDKFVFTEVNGGLIVDGKNKNNK